MSTEPPTPPTDLPAYVVDPIERQDPESLEAIKEYVDALLAYHRDVEAQDLDEDDLADDDEEVVETEDTAGGTVVIKKIPCGKGCDGCPHGPYKYVVRREGGSLNWDYRGPVKG